MKHEVYWTDMTPRPAELPTHELPARADVAVVGGGYCGLNAALTLAREGVSVAVLERHTIGWGASSRNGGFCGTGLIVPPQALAERYGPETARALWKWARQSRDFLLDLIRQEKIECDLDMSGQLSLAYKASHLAHLKAYREIAADWTGSPEPPLLEREALAEEIGSEFFPAALVLEEGGALNPAKYVFGLASAAAAAGARLVEGADVGRIQRANGHYRVITDAGSLRASKVLMATNGYTGRVAGRARYGIIRAACYTIVTEPLPEGLRRSISPRGRSFFDTRRLLSYFRLTADGRMLFGGSDSLAANLDLEGRARNLRRRMLEIFPQLRESVISHVWTGQLGLTFDQMPHIGREGGVYYAYGFNGHGVTIASYMGHEVAKLISGRSTDGLFQQIEHPRYFFAPMESVYMPMVCAWYRWRDRLA